MGQPKKLTHKQRQERAVMTRIAPIDAELKRIYHALKTASAEEVPTWRWAALEIFRSLQVEQSHEQVDKLKEKALYIAREAQAVMNFTL